MFIKGISSSAVCQNFAPDFWKHFFQLALRNANVEKPTTKTSLSHILWATLNAGFETQRQNILSNPFVGQHLAPDLESNAGVGKKRKDASM